MTTTPKPGSTVRYVSGVISLVMSLVVLAGSFVQMVRALEATGYGSRGVTTALIWMGVGGGLLGFGIAMLIWELSVRYDVRH